MDTATSLTVWTRLSEGQVSAHAETSLDGGTTWTPTLSKTSAGADGYTLAWPITGLLPSQDVTYRVVVEGDPTCVPTPARTTRTAPPPTEPVAFGFAVTSDARDNLDEGMPPWSAIASKQAAFVLQIGDWDHRNPGAGGNTQITDWRKMHRDMLGDEPVGSTLAEHIFEGGIPLFHTWDDHDYGDNNADRTLPGRVVATDAFREFFPTPNTPVEGTVAYSFRWGALTEFFVLDTRSKRDPDGDPDGPDHSMLGWGPDSQREWLKSSVKNSTATFKIVVSSTVWNPNSKPIDSWARYQYEQGVLIDYWANQGVTGIVFATGDLHSVGLIDDGTNGSYPNISVPPINLDRNGCTGGPCGSWSVPWEEVHPHAGFGWFDVWRDAQGDHLKMAAYGSEGAERRSLTVSVP